MSLRSAICSFLAVFLTFGSIGACSDDETGTTNSGDDAGAGGDTSTTETSPPQGVPTIDAGTDSNMGADSASCPGEIKTGNGETCIGYGTGSTCDPACGQPYGYVCFDGPPPGFTGCREISTSALVGNSYCCPKNDCVAQPDQNGACGDAGASTTKRFQCPPGSTAPAGCVEHNSGSTNLEKFYCCP